MRFTIRDLLWLTVVVALGVGWWVDRTRQNDRIKAIEARVDSGLVAIEGVLHHEGWQIEWQQHNVHITKPDGTGYVCGIDEGSPRNLPMRYLVVPPKVDWSSPNPSAPAKNPPKK